MVILSVTEFDQRATKSTVVAIRDARLRDRLSKFQSEPNVSPKKGTTLGSLQRAERGAGDAVQSLHVLA